MRNAGRIKLGYFPLLVEEAQRMRALLVPSAPYAAIDPCVGDGTALVELTKNMRHTAHWRSVKYVDEFNEEGETEGETIIRKRERFSHELTLAYESGQVVELKETKEVDPVSSR